VTSRKHAELLPILRQATAECDEVGAASRNQLHRSSKHASQGSDPTNCTEITTDTVDKNNLQIITCKIAPNVNFNRSSVDLLCSTNLKFGYSFKTLIIILLHVVHWFPRWQHWCCRASRKLCSNYLLTAATACAIRFLRANWDDEVECVGGERFPLSFRCTHAQRKLAKPVRRKKIFDR